jgi:Tfp pilus assembly protein PilF
MHLSDSYLTGRLLGTVVNTLRETFPHVYVITSRAGLSSPRGTFVIAATTRVLDPQAILAEHVKHLDFSLLDDTQINDLKERCGSVIFTDDYAPVESLLAPVVRHAAPEILARKCFDRARELQNNNCYEQSIQWYCQAMNSDPSMTIEVCRQLGLMYTASNKLEEAMEAFHAALRAGDEAGNGRAELGSIHMKLGLLLGRTDKPTEGKEQLAQAVEAFRRELDEYPTSVVLWEQLGETSVRLGDFKGASDAFDKAVALEPRNASLYDRLARALEFQRRYDEAIAVVRKHIQLLQEQGRRDLVTQLNHYADVLAYKKVKQAK